MGNVLGEGVQAALSCVTKLNHALATHSELQAVKVMHILLYELVFYVSPG